MRFLPCRSAPSHHFYPSCRDVVCGTWDGCTTYGKLHKEAPRNLQAAPLLASLQANRKPRASAAITAADWWPRAGSGSTRCSCFAAGSSQDITNRRRGRICHVRDLAGAGYSAIAAVNVQQGRCTSAPGVLLPVPIVFASPREAASAEQKKPLLRASPLLALASLVFARRTISFLTDSRSAAEARGRSKHASVDYSRQAQLRHRSIRRGQATCVEAGRHLRLPRALCQVGGIPHNNLTSRRSRGLWSRSLERQAEGMRGRFDIDLKQARPMSSGVPVLLRAYHFPATCRRRPS